MWGIIATWRMSLESVEKACELLKENGTSDDVLEMAIREVEDTPFYKSVGYGGLPNEEMEVELDAGFMNGDTLSFGAVMALRDFANPISIARALSKREVNTVLVGEGAEKFAHKAGFERKNMLTERAKTHYEKQLKKKQEESVQPYQGHDTVGMVVLDQKGHMSAGTSTSGLFMKKKGRVGDSPIIGSGLYVDDNIGGAAATGLGEDLMKGCISYEIVRLMKEGMHPQKACETAVNQLHNRLKKNGKEVGDLSVVAMNHLGECGFATNIKEFSAVVCKEGSTPCVYLISRAENGDQHIETASKEWVEEYIKQRMKADSTLI